MRAELTIALVNGTAIIREVRPLDFKLALVQIMQSGDMSMSEVSPEQWNACWLAGLLIEIKGEANNDDLMLIRERFVWLNRSFFEAKEVTSQQAQAIKNSANRKKLSQVDQELAQECAVLVSYNHQNCWLYGWSFFQIVQDQYRKK
jgi:hypothetical protein